MNQTSRLLMQEIDRRVAEGRFGSVDELVRAALDALDREQALEVALREGLKSGPAKMMTPDEWERIRRDGINRLRSPG